MHPTWKLMENKLLRKNYGFFVEPLRTFIWSSNLVVMLNLENKDDSKLFQKFHFIKKKACKVGIT